MSRVKVILNPYSGRGTGARMWPELEAALRQADVEFDVALTERVGHGIELTERALQDGYSVVMAAGGDGTISEVVNGLVAAAPPDAVAGTLAVAPLGTGNDFAATFGGATDIAGVANAVAAGRTKQLDLGLATVHSKKRTVSRYFDNNMGIGFEAQVTLESYKIKRLSGFALYLAAALRCVVQYRSPHMDVSWLTSEGTAGEQSRETLLVTVGNSRRTGGGFYLTPDAIMDDGFLDVGVARHVPRWQLLTLLPRAMFGKHTTDPAITMLRVVTLNIHIPEGAPVQIDGEVVADQAHDIAIKVLPGKLRVIV